MNPAPLSNKQGYRSSISAQLQRTLDAVGMTLEWLGRPGTGVGEWRVPLQNGAGVALDGDVEPAVAAMILVSAGRT